MTVFILYLLEASICLLVLGLFYILAWQKLSFHMLKRCFVITIIVFVVFAPMLEAPWSVKQHEQLNQLSEVVGEWELEVQEVVENEALWENATISLSPNPSTLSWTIGDLILIIYFLGFWVAFIRLSKSLLAIWQIMRQQHLTFQDGYWLAKTKLPHSFSFASILFLAQEHIQLPKKEQRQIILHERAHIQQRHTLDILLIEIVGLFFWFHPMIYFLRKELKQLHEYLADREVLKHTPPLEYAQLLLKLAIRKPTLSLSLIHPFIYVSLKNRIIMMNNQTSSKWKLLLMFPAFMILSALWVLFSPAFAEIKAEVQPMIAQKIVASIDQSLSVPDNWPIDGGNIVSGFGMRKNPYTKVEQLHTGIDITAPTGTFVFAAGKGTIMKTGFDKKKGKFIEIEHGSQFQTHYFHLVEIGVKEGEIVKRGQQIGKSGNTGLSKGPHLHFEIWKDGKAVDPLQYIKKDIPSNTFEANIPKGSPIKDAELLSGYGMRMHPVKKIKKMHLGVDFKAPLGTPVYATADGKIILSENQTKGYGIHIKIQHADDYQTLYAHLSKVSFEVGAKIKAGDIIGYSGNSGLSQKPHLHYEVIKAGKRVDPAEFLSTN